MKKNDKGFMLFETLVVSTFVLGTLIFLYIQFSAIKRNYDITFRYNTIQGLYYIKNISDFLITDGYQGLVNALEISENGYIDISESNYYSHPEYNLSSFYHDILDSIGVKTIIFTAGDISKLKSYITSVDKEYSNDFKQFILSRELVNETSYNRLIVEFNDNTYAEITIGKDKTI